MKRALTIWIAFVLIGQSLLAQERFPYQDPSLPIGQRVADLLARMTPEEKFWQLFMIPGDLDKAQPGQYKNGIFGFQVSAASKGDESGQLLQYNTSENPLALTRKINAIQRYFVEQTRLGIPIIAFDEALHGLVRDGATSFPQSIALAASWDTSLMHKVATAIAIETKARGIRDILTPVVNIASDVRWGRTEETYGEDPFLSGEMGVAFVSAFEKMGIITTPKHFIANVGDGGRDSYPIHFNERLLEEIYLPPFRACIERGGSRSVMTAYNSLDGISCSTNSWLLQEKLKKEWNFGGFVISDANAVGGDIVLHHTARNYGEAGRNAVNNGLDVIFQTDYNHHKLFIPPFLNGEVNARRIDEAVARVLKAKFELGLFEQPYVTEEAVTRLVKNAVHKPIARQAARESMVLLKNSAGLLPVGKGVRSIALIGQEATAARLGGYSGNGNGKISILDGVKKRATVPVYYAPGMGVKEEDWEIVPATALRHAGGEGLAAEYFDNIALEGKPAVTRVDKELNFLWTLSGPDRSIKKDNYSARWTGQVRSSKTGRFNIGLDGNDGFRLYINGKLVIDNWQKQTYSTKLVSHYFEKGKPYDIKVEFYEALGNAKIRLVWNESTRNDRQQRMAEAVATAKKADIAVVVAGIHEGEFQDRAYLSLPSYEEEMIKAVAATGKPVVVILTGGSAITMDKWLDKVDAVLHAWYPGEEGGAAVAELLFGDYSPSGRLPITFPQHESQLPLVYNHKPTGRGDDYHNLSGLPLFPFGYGLSYTNFEYKGISLSQARIRPDGTVTVDFTVRNSGKYAGAEVVQLYIRDMLASVSRPVMELKGFRKVYLQPGEEKRLQFVVTPGMLSMLDKDLKRVVEPGEFRIMIGSSSRDIRLKETLVVE